MASGYKLFTYDAGTTTKRTTYTDSALTSANANPIVLDAYGRASIYLSPTSYKFVFAPPSDSDPPIAAIWTADNVSAYSTLNASFDLSGTAGETITANDVVYLSDGSGGATAGRWYKTDADQTYSSSAAVTVGIAIAGIASGSTGSIRHVGQMVGLSGLTAGTVYYASATAGALTSTAPTNALTIGKADSTTTLIVDPSWGVGNATARGMMSFIAQSIAGVKTFNTQPVTYIGTAVTLPATVGGVYFADTASYTVSGNSTDSVMSSTTIPANMLNADGKAVLVHLGSSTGMGGGGIAKILELDIGGTQVVLRNNALNESAWFGRYLIIRTASDRVNVYGFFYGKDLGLVAPASGAAIIITGLTFTAAIALRSLGTTTAGATITQTFFVAQALG